MTSPDEVDGPDCECCQRWVAAADSAESEAARWRVIADGESDRLLEVRKRVLNLDADLHRLAQAAMRVVEDFYAPGECDCDPDVGIETCAACEIRAVHRSLLDDGGEA